MKTVTNITSAPLKVPLPRNKFLRLGPGKSGQLSHDSAERPALVKMVEAGQIEISEASSATSKGGGGSRTFGSAGGPGGSRGIGRRGGDR